MEKINVLYDATLICKILKNNSSRSGIFFVAYNVLLELLKREDFNVYLYSSKPVKLRQVINQYKEFNKCKIYKPVLINYVDFLLKMLVKKNNKFIKVFFSLQNFLLKTLYKFYFGHLLSFDDIDVYFSPAFAVPEFIRRNKDIKVYTILHDAIPLVNNFRKNISYRWFYKLINSIESNDKYFSNSEYTKSDFIKHVPKINEDNITVIPLSTGKPYFRL